MSLFTETVNRVAQLETELAAAHERIRNLEIALNAARRDKMKAMNWRGHSASSFPDLGAKQTNHDLNSLSEGDVEELFRQHKEAKLDDQVAAWSAPSEDGKEPTVRRGFLSPVLKMCALFKR